MFKLASLFVEIKAKDEALNSQLGAVKERLGAFGVAVGTAAGNLAAGAIGAAASAVAGFLARGIAGATNLAETLSKVNAVFGEATSTVTNQADAMAAAFGLPKQAILDASASIGLVAKSAGQSGQAAADLSAKMAKLAADASSFYNVGLDDALNKIRSGLVGEAEPLRAFGVLLSEEAVSAEAVALGLAKSAKEVDNQAKVMARASLITKGLADASGDLERTADSTANQFRKFTGSLENMAVEVGTALAPAVNELIGLFNDLAVAVRDGAENNKGIFRGFIDSVTDGLKTLRMEFRNAADLAALNWLSLTNPFGSGAVKEQLELQILAREAALAAEITNHQVAAAAAAAKKVDAQAALARHAEAEAAALKQAKQHAEEHAKLVKQNEQAFDARRKYEERLDRQAERVAAEKVKKDQFTSSIIGAADLVNNIRSAIFSTGDDTAKQQLAAQKEIAKNTQRMADKAFGAALAVLG